MKKARLLPEERRNAILAMLEQEGRVFCSELADTFGVSEMTIRRDLTYLERLGALRKVHGAAVSVEDESHDPSFWVRAGRSRGEKRAIGREAAKLIGNGEVIAIDVGTTALEVARNITCTDVIIITASPHVAFNVVNQGISQVFLTGGVMRPQTFTLTGAFAVQGLNNFNISKAFIGIGGITDDYFLTEHSPEEAEVKKALIKRSEEVILVADHTKFNSGGFVKIGPLALVHRIITDKRMSQNLIDYAERNRISVTSVG